jgi:hypothetical protein
LIRFSQAIREELWSRGRLLESRLAHGEAVETDDGIVATDARDETLVAACDVELERLRDAMPDDALVRLVAESSTEGTSATMTVRIGALSIVTTPEHVEEDLLLLECGGKAAAFQSGGLAAALQKPLLWLHGSASILLHEAIGHPLEHDQAPLPLPSWLHVDIPMRRRRATFRDVPLQRMTHVFAQATGAPFDVPEEHIEIHLVDGGAYDPLTEMVTLRIAAAKLVSSDEVHPIAPFDIVETRANVIRALAGAEGEALRYPGVVCSREGQELVVGSFAPAMLTVFR